MPDQSLALALSYRYMAEQDLAQVLQNERSGYSHPWTEGIFRECLGGISECWVVLQQGEIIGHTIVSHVLDEGHLLNLCIGKPWQGQGLSHEVLGFVMERLRALGATTVFLEVRESNRVAQSLYKKHGFTQIGLRKNYYPASSTAAEHAIVMSHSI